MVGGAAQCSFVAVRTPEIIVHNCLLPERQPPLSRPGPCSPGLSFLPGPFLLVLPSGEQGSPGRLQRMASPGCHLTPLLECHRP